ncbi:hypothetical protein AB9F41_16120 [Rhizobium leguminosarum]|uniref:hypothetical protein n=1 Tax=Rhizobium leguminosarum TaxID=384 RepID=UPI003F9889EB
MSKETDYLGQNATIEMILESVPNSEEYVRQVLSNMTGMNKQCAVRIRIGGSRGSPDYIIDELFFDDDDPEHTGQPVPMKAFNGRTHKEIVDFEFYERDHWAYNGLSFREVQAILGRLLGIGSFSGS